MSKNSVISVCLKRQVKVVKQMRITGGEARGIQLEAPRSPHFRPTSDRVRSALFQIISEALIEARVLDLYAGSGALGIEALSRGAKAADFVEQNGRLCRAIGQNLRKAGLEEQGTIHRAKVARALDFLKGQYQVVLLDPPYDLPDLEQTMSKVARSGLIAERGLVVLEHSKRTDAKERYDTLELSFQRRYGDTVLSVYK